MKKTITTFNWLPIYNQIKNKTRNDIPIQNIIDFGNLLERECKSGVLSNLYKQEEHKIELDKFIFFFQKAVYDYTSFLFIFKLFFIWGNKYIENKKLCKIIPALKKI